ncbi:hypothetical protein H8E88_10215 [candidate division KSB1 bacterium]|nr:hypothetical protein [candidate division KSB1 bacterium]
MNNRKFSKNISLTFRKKAIVVFLFFSFFHTDLMLGKLVSQDSVKVNKTDSTVTSRSLPKWLLDQKKNQTVQPSEILKKNNDIMWSVLFTGIVMIFFVVSVSIFIIKRSRQGT